MIKIKITWPAAILILVTLLIWLSRPSAPAQRKPVRQPRRPSMERPQRRPAQTESVIIIDQRHDTGTPEGTPDISYEEAIRAPLGTYTEDQIDAIAQRELAEAAHEGFDSVRRENPFFVRTPAWRK